jgi:hypothetical protein
MGLKSPEKVACGSGGGADCFLLDIDSIETYLASEDSCLGI